MTGLERPPPLEGFLGSLIILPYALHRIYPVHDFHATM